MTHLTKIPIHPKTFDVPQRVEASAKATELGCGLMMEVRSSSTHYFADPEVPIGKVDVYCPKEYKGIPEYVTTLNSPEDHWEPESAAKMRRLMEEITKKNRGDL